MLNVGDISKRMLNSERAELSKKKGKLVCCLLVILIFSGSSANTATGETSTSVSKYHMSAIKEACADMRSRRSSQIMCMSRMRTEYAGELLDVNRYLEQNLLDADSFNQVITQCEGIKFYGHPEGRLAKYDKCLRKYINLAEPPKIKPTRILRRKPQILVVHGRCTSRRYAISGPIEDFRSYMMADLRKKVGKIIGVEDFIAQFWCSNRKLFFREIGKIYPVRDHLYTLSIDFITGTHFDDDLGYELYDVKNQTLISRGDLFRGKVIQVGATNIRKRAANASSRLIEVMSDYQNR